MIEAVFISDLHLHPENKAIAKRFDDFLAWIPETTKALYILGDFFHIWVGDDTLDMWSMRIALQIRSLKNKGIQVYFMAGNRDFLLGKRFAQYSGWTVLPEPTLIQCGDEKVLLVHGDGYCTQDQGHQKLRLFTRNTLFCTIFRHIPLALRLYFAGGARLHSQKRKPGKTKEMMDVVKEDVLAHMKAMQVHTLIHGHTHKQGLTEYQEQDALFRRYVLSDWDDEPIFLCYDRSNGFYFAQEGQVVCEN